LLSINCWTKHQKILKKVRKTQNEMQDGSKT
jgi:hypothetical protein